MQSCAFVCKQCCFLLTKHDVYCLCKYLWALAASPLYWQIKFHHGIKRELKKPRWTCFSRGLRQDDSQRSLPTPNHSVILHEINLPQAHSPIVWSGQPSPLPRWYRRASCWLHGISPAVHWSATPSSFTTAGCEPSSTTLWSVQCLGVVYRTADFKPTFLQRSLAEPSLSCKKAL